MRAGTRLGFFGGSFDPPHLGHLAIARAAAKAFSLDRVLVVPTAQQPLKPTGLVAPFEARLAMVALLCADDASFEASPLEAPNTDGTPNFTVDTLAQLRSSLDEGDEIFVLIGADAFLDLRRWRQPERLLQLAEWVVISRPGFWLDDLSPLALSAAELARVHVLGGVAEPASATRIRQLLHAGSDCAGLLPPAVVRYIRDHHLYGT
jgi:nicotinate-nucleotide adenylyltransferase